MLRYNDPACSCKPCVQPEKTITSRIQRPTAHLQRSTQDATRPTSFFRLSAEIRNKVYFLSFRPDCHFSFGRTEKCEKKHIHQSTVGREESWKWLSLCRQSWSEATQYVAIIKHGRRFFVGMDNCPRCWTSSHEERTNSEEGMLHAHTRGWLYPRSMKRELVYVRLREITIGFEEYDTTTTSEGHDYDRFNHNLASFVLFMSKMPNLRKLTINIDKGFEQYASGHRDIIKNIRSLFRIASKLQGTRELVVHVERAIELSDLDVPEQDVPSACPLLQMIVRQGFPKGKLTTTTRVKDEDTEIEIFGSRSWHIAFQEKCAKDQRWWKQLRASQLLFRTSLFDEDFDSLSDGNSQYHSSLDANGTTTFHFDSNSTWGPTYDTMSGCCIHTEEKYSCLHEKYLPLYLEEDFYHGTPVDMDTYKPIPECSFCGMVFAGFAELQAHTTSRRCEWPSNELEWVVLVLEQNVTS